MDPIVIERSLAFLDVAAGGDGASVSKAWRSVCGSWALWHDLSQPLRKWKNIAVDARLHPREFCRLSIADAKRTALTRDELCSQTWRFRFKRAAGEEWLAVVSLLRPTPTPSMRHIRAQDPYWTDNNPATITFTADGTTERAGTWELEVEVKWRWGHSRKARRSPGVAGGESGSSVRVVVDGRDVPTCVEIKILRRVRAESPRRPPRNRRDACSMAWRCRFLAARPSQDSRAIAAR